MRRKSRAILVIFAVVTLSAAAQARITKVVVEDRKSAGFRWARLRRRRAV